MGNSVCMSKRERLNPHNWKCRILKRFELGASIFKLLAVRKFDD